MATYKVPQNVEADDKLLGPFTFRQFIYLIIVAMGGFIAWALSNIFIGFIVIPLPIMIFFGVLALPLRKDQPMEIYMAAMVSFYLKPRRRLWDPEGVETLIEITAPKTVEQSRVKDISQNEAEQRLSYLANIVDSQGWAIRGVGGANGTAMNQNVYAEAQTATDVLDTNTTIAQNFDNMMNQATTRTRDEARQHMMQATQATASAPMYPVTSDVSADALLSDMSQQLGVAPPPVPPPAPTPQPQANSIPATSRTAYTQDDTQDDTKSAHRPHYNPYPTFHQSVIQPLNDAAHQAQSDINATQPIEEAESTSDSPPSADIMNLANNPDLSIETIAHEAQRLHKKAEEESEEVVISLR